MTTMGAENLKVIGINGDFDDSQEALKDMLKDESFYLFLKSKNRELSVANSINFGRIAFQIVYHIWGYLELVRCGKIALGDGLKIVVPSGNFGNALGAFYARLMGVNIEKIIIASNTNNILSDFINSGIYDIRDRKLTKTDSPAMDILKSSNVERVLFTLFGEERTRELMENLDRERICSLDSDELDSLREIFLASFCSDVECREIVKSFFEDGYLLDPHTATAIKAYREQCDGEIAVVCSTAEWTKFAPTVASAIGGGKMDDREALDFVSKSAKVSIHKNTATLFKKDEVHRGIVDVKSLKDEIKNWIEGRG